MPALQLALAQAFEHGGAHRGVCYRVPRAGGVVERIHRHHTRHPAQLANGSELQPEIPVLEHQQVFIETAGLRAARCGEPEHHRVNRQVILKLQQGPVEIARVDMADNRCLRAARAAHRLHIPVAGQHLRLRLERAQQLLEMVRQQLVVVVKKNRVIAGGSVQQRVGCSSAPQRMPRLYQPRHPVAQGRRQAAQRVAAGVHHHQLPVRVGLRDDRGERLGQAGPVDGPDQDRHPGLHAGVGPLRGGQGHGGGARAGVAPKRVARQRRQCARPQRGVGRVRVHNPVGLSRQHLRRERVTAVLVQRPNMARIVLSRELRDKAAHRRFLTLDQWRDVEECVGSQRSTDFVKGESRRRPRTSERRDGERAGLLMVGMVFPRRGRINKVCAGRRNRLQQSLNQRVAAAHAAVGQAPELRFAIAQQSGGSAALRRAHQGVAVGRAVAQHHHLHRYALEQVRCNGAAAAKNLVVRMRRQHQNGSGGQDTQGLVGNGVGFQKGSAWLARAQHAQSVVLPRRRAKRVNGNGPAASA